MALAPKAKGVTLDLPVVDRTASTDDRVSQLHSALSTLVDQLTTQLNPFMTSTQTALRGGIAAENIQRQTSTITVTSASFPFQLTVTLPTRPVRVSVDQITTVSGSPPSGAVDVKQWNMVAPTTLEIIAMPGLSANSTYTVALSIE